MRLPYVLALAAVACHSRLGPSAPVEPPPPAEVVARLDPHGFPVPAIDGDVRRRSPGLASVGPREDAAKGSAKVSESAQPYVHFAQPMRTDGSAPTFELDPPVSGDAVWIDPYRAWFMPSEPLKLGQRYRVRVSGRPETATGEALALSEAWSFETRPAAVGLDVDRQWWGDEESAPPLHWLTPVLVTSEIQIAAGDLRGHVRARAWKKGGDRKRAKEIAVRVLGPDDLDPLPDGLGDRRGTIRVYPGTRWPAGMNVAVEVDGAFAPPGAGPIGKAVVAEFVVADGVHAKVQCYEDHGDGCDPYGLQVQFDGPIDDAMAKHITVEPRPKGLKVEVTYGTAYVAGEFQPHRRYRVHFGTGMRDRYGQPLAGPRRVPVTFVPPPPKVELIADAGVVRPELPPTVGLEARYVRRALLRAAVPTERAFAALEGRELEEVAFPTDVEALVEREMDLAPKGRYAWSSIALDLAELTKGKRRPVIVEVTPLEVTPAGRKRPRPTTTRALYQLSGLGAAAWLSHGEARVQLRALDSFEPVKGASIEVLDPSGRVVHATRTDAGGIAGLPRDRALPTDSLLLAKTEKDRLLVRVGEEAPADHDGDGEIDESWGDDGKDRTISEVVTERGIYRPGELVSIVGWAAISTPRTSNGLAPVKPGTAVELQLLDRNHEVVARRKVGLGKQGKYWARLPLRDDVALGRYTAVAKIGKEEFTAGFEVRDVRVPEFAVEATAVDAQLARGHTAEIVAHANYYFGGVVPIVESRATTQCRARWDLPPGLEPGWRIVGLADEAQWHRGNRELAGKPRVTADGELRVELATKELLAGVGHTCQTDLAVQDASFSEVGASTAWFVHPSRYLLVKSKRVAADKQMFTVRAVDRDGKRRAGPAVVVTTSRVERVEKKDGTVEEKLVEVDRCRIETRASGDSECRTPALKPGHYRAVLTSEVDGAALSWSDHWWASEPRKIRPHAPVDSLTIAVDAENPEPGTTLRVQLAGPVGTNHGVLAVSHMGLRRIVPFQLRKGQATIELPVTDAWIPNVSLDGFLVVAGKSPKDAPRTFQDSQEIEVGVDSRRLQVVVDAPEVARIRSELPITVRVASRDGKPVAGHVAVWAVDEALHSLVPPTIPDFVSTFAARRWMQTRFVETYSSVLEPYEPVEDPFVLGLTGFGGGGGGTGSGTGMGGMGLLGAGSSPTRARFEGTPIFIGDAVVGKDGIARVRGRLPDNLTTFRVTAIASANVESSAVVGRFGHADARVRVTAPLVVRAALPRILRPGDEAEAAAIVDNLGGPAGKVEVAIDLDDAKGRLELVEAPRKPVHVAAGGQVRVPFRVRALGTGVAHVETRATLRARGLDRDLTDAIRLPLPIERAADLVRHAAVYGSSDEDGTFAVALARPDDLGNRNVRVDVELSGSMLAGLDDMAEGLAQYPYGCVEQTSSGLLPLAALAGLSRAGYLSTNVDAHVASGIARLRAMQVDGGGLAYWPGGSHPHAWGTAWALYVLEQLRANGHAVPESLRAGMRDWLATRVGLRRTSAADDEDDAEPEEVERFDDLTAVMAVQALVAAGERPTAAITALHERRSELPVFARALLLLAEHESSPETKSTSELRDELLAQLDERQGVASVRPGDTYYDELFDTQTRTEAMVLLALLRAAPDDPRVEKLTRNLGQLRASGRIANTQERAYSLLALAEYARTREPDAADLAADVWIGARPVTDVELRGRTAPAVERTARVVAPATGEVGRVTLRREGKGRLYWRVGMQWTPKHAGKRPSAHGIAVERTLRTRAGAVGESSIRAGELVALDVTIRLDAATRYVAVDLPLPPGLEAVDDTIGAGGRARVLTGGRGHWVSHQELRRDRAVVFADALGPGTHHTTVFLRATTPGRYAIPPAVAHAMYLPEIRGHSAETSVVVASPVR